MSSSTQNNWTAKRLKYLATINDEALPENTDPDLEISYIDIGNVDSAGIAEAPTTYRFENAPSRARRIVKHGDVIISTVRTYLQAIAPIENPPVNLIVSTGFAVVRPMPNELDMGFCKYALRESSFLSEVEKRSVGVSYPAVNSSELGDILIKTTSIETQRLIAAYLDRETARIDALIAAKERLLALLGEKRQALITRAVTRGLEESVKMKNSGVAWLGEVPEGWEVKKVKFLGDIYYGLSQPPEYQMEGLPLIRATNVYRGIIKKEGLVFINENDLPPSKKVVLKSGDIIIVRSGAYTADSALITEEWEGAIAGFDMIFRPNELILPRFLAYVFLCGYVLDNQLIPMSVRAAQPHLNAEELGSVQVVTPPTLMEQATIVDYIQTHTARIDAIRTAAERSIALLRERRSALIAAAVTGRVEVESAS